ncbi:MAG: Rpn family recombination-promoting nuclease/putative transposase [Bacilli bacterium]|nr:Rpn family recombination-promoting nuclease/putative transposase [Bacilli bacterium]
MKLENIKKMKERGEVFPGTYDHIFKSVIEDDNLRDFTAFIVGRTIGKTIDEESIVFINPEYTKDNALDKGNITDVLMLANGGDRISLEMNRRNDNDLIKRNRSHLFEGMVKTINVSFKNGIDYYFMQICFDNFSLKDKLISTYKLTDLEDGIVDEENENFVKYRINLAKIYKKYYTLDEELTRFEKALAILSFNKVADLRKLSGGDEMLMRVVKKIEELTDDPDMVQYIDVEKGMELGRKQDIEIAAKKAAEKAAKEAAKEATKKEKIETAKKMLEKSMKLEDIIDITGLSKEEIQKMKD